MKEDRLLAAIKLREYGQNKESNQLLIDLVQLYPNDSQINYQCAWSYDLLGEEVKAVPYYEKAILLGLPEEELEGALIGLGSTYRTLGEFEKSQEVFSKAKEKFPDNRVIQVFHAMTLYNLKEHAKAMEILLKCLSETTNDTNIKQYKKAIEFYSDKLESIWN